MLVFTRTKLRHHLAEQLNNKDGTARRSGNKSQRERVPARWPTLNPAAFVLVVLFAARGLDIEESYAGEQAANVPEEPSVYRRASRAAATGESIAWCAG